MSLSLVDERELLLHYRPWLRKVAGGMTRRLRATYVGDIAEDLAQEGWIALWQATMTYDGRGGVTLDYWLRRSAHDRMRVVLRLLMARCRDVNKTVIAGDPWGRINDRSELSSENIWSSLTVDLLDIEFAYHHGEIAEAMAELTPRQREYVYLRYCRGCNTRELIEHFGYQPTTIGVTVKKKLKIRLAHLV